MEPFPRFDPPLRPPLVPPSAPPPPPPPRIPYPPAAGPAVQPPSVPPGRRSRRVRTGVAVVAVGALALVGGTGAGWIAGRSAAHNEVMGPVAARSVSATFAGGSLDAAAVVEKLKPSVVSITSTISTGDGYGYRFGGGSATAQAAGSGVILTAGGEVLTNAHVVAQAQSISVTLANGKTYPAKVLGADTSEDLALLKLDGAPGLTPAQLGSSAALRVGDDVVAIGNALDLRGAPTVTRGIVSALDRSISTDEASLGGLIQTDAAISSGNSGGPLVNADGQVVGIDTAVATGSSTVSAQNIGFAIPIDHVSSVLARFRSGS